MNIKDTIENKLKEHMEVKYIDISDTCLLYTSDAADE